MKIMVISPHPDDETLGAGGSLLKLKEEGNSIFWLNATNMKPEYGYDEGVVKKRNLEIDKVRQQYGFDGFCNMELEPAGLDKYPTGELVSKIKNVFEDYKPELLLMPFSEDIHSDHRVLCDAIYSCIKSFRAPYLKTVLSMEIISETDQAKDSFVPNVYVDISDYIDKKIEIMKIYESEIRRAPFPRNADSIRGLAAFRGATSNYKYAESFQLIRGRID